MVNGKVKIKNPTGLHLRPAGLFCKTAMQFQSKITVLKKTKHEDVTANAKSVLSVLGACIKSGDEIQITCESIVAVSRCETGLGSNAFHSLKGAT